MFSQPVVHRVNFSMKTLNLTPSCIFEQKRRLKGKLWWDIEIKIFFVTSNILEVAVGKKAHIK